MVERSAILLLFVVLGVAAAAQEFTLGGLTITDPWSRELPPVAPNGAAYFGVENRGASADRIVSVHTPIAKRAELHAHETSGTMMSMRHVEVVDVPAGASVPFEPAGLHVMLFELTEPLRRGTRYPLTVVFENAGAVEVTVEVRGGGGDS